MAPLWAASASIAWRGTSARPHSSSNGPVGLLNGTTKQRATRRLATGKKAVGLEAQDA